MHNRSLLCAALTLIAATAFAAELPPRPPSEWKDLFNARDFGGWDKHVVIPGQQGPIVPNRDPNNIFVVTNTEGAPAIRVSGQTYGAITTKDEFDNFHFRVDFKWGEKRWPPREKVGRDTGILYCAIGQPNPGTGWLTSVENNIMEKGVGQWWSVNGAIIDTEGEFITSANELYVPYKKEGDGEKNIVWKRGAPRITAATSNGITPPFDVEQVFGNWNRVEVVYWGGHCIHILNGHVNTVLVNPRYKESEQWRALHRGKIQLQSEGAETWYRNIQIRPLFELPKEFLSEALSPVANEDGFKPLLAEGELKNWKQSGPGKFQVENGVATGEGGMGLWWYSAQQYTNFVLRGDFLQVQEIADSGIYFRFPDPGNDPMVAVHKGHEVEIGDPKAENPTWHTGSLYPFQPPVSDASKPIGQWNNYEIVCRGHDYSVRLNDKLVTTWTDHTARTLSGFIGIQNYPDKKTVRHRNLRIKEIL